MDGKNRVKTNIELFFDAIRKWLKTATIKRFTSFVFFINR